MSEKVKTAKYKVLQPIYSIGLGKHVSAGEIVEYKLTGGTQDALDMLCKMGVLEAIDKESNQGDAKELPLQD